MKSYDIENIFDSDDEFRCLVCGENGFMWYHYDSEHGLLRDENDRDIIYQKTRVLR